MTSDEDEDDGPRADKYKETHWTTIILLVWSDGHPWLLLSTWARPQIPAGWRNKGPREWTAALTVEDDKVAGSTPLVDVPCSSSLRPSEHTGPHLSGPEGPFGNEGWIKCHGVDARECRHDIVECGTSHSRSSDRIRSQKHRPAQRTFRRRRTEEGRRRHGHGINLTADVQ
jgi:hypothetical protein